MSRVIFSESETRATGVNLKHKSSYDKFISQINLQTSQIRTFITHVTRELLVVMHYVYEGQYVILSYESECTDIVKCAV